MKHRQWTLKRLMIAIVWIALGIAPLVRPSKVWGLVLPVVILGLDLTAILGVVLRRGSKRAYWLGFALFGWAYLLLLSLASDEHGLFNPRPLGSILAEYLERWIELFAIPSLMTDPGNQPVKMEDLLQGVRQLAEEVDDTSRIVIAGCMASLAFSVMGARIAQWLSMNEALPADPEPTSDATGRPDARSDSAPAGPN